MGFIRLSALAAVVLAASSCGGIIDPSENKMEPFSGTLAVGATNTTNYTTSKNGEIEVTLTSLSPTPANGSIGFGFGQVFSGGCSQVVSPQPAVVNRKIQLGFYNKGTYCLAVFDPGILTVPVTYTGIFSHP